MSLICLEPINLFKCPIQCWRCFDICCSCGAGAGRATNVPAFVIILGVFLHCIFIFVQCFLKFLSTLYPIIVEIILFLVPTKWLTLTIPIIGIPIPIPLHIFTLLILLYFWQIFAPTVLNFIMNALIPFINVIFDIWCFITFVTFTIWRIISLIWNMIVPLIGLILYVVMVIIVEVFFAIVVLLLDILFEILAA